MPNVTYHLSYPRQSVNPDQLRAEVEALGNPDVGMNYRPTDNGDWFMSITVPDDVAVETVIDWIETNHHPNAAWGVDDPMPTDEEFDQLDMAAIIAFVKRISRPERYRVNELRARTIAEGEANGWPVL